MNGLHFIYVGDSIPVSDGMLQHCHRSAVQTHVEVPAMGSTRRPSPQHMHVCAAVHLLLLLHDRRYR